MKITEILSLDCIRVPLEAGDKQAAIAELVGVLDQAGRLQDREQVLKAVLAREATRSTGIGQTLAVPHGKSNGCRALTMAVGMPQSPIEFDAIDGKPCKFIVLLASPVDKTGPHIQALASVSRLWLNESFRADVMRASTPEDVMKAIETHEG